VELDGVLGEFHPPRDLFIREPFGEHVEDFALARRQRVEFRFVRPPPARRL
jgi:hypothetical protein